MATRSEHPGKSIDLNTASEGEIAQVPGVGQKRAREIVALRDRQGGRLKSLDDLRQLDSFSDKMVESCRDYFTVGRR